MRDIIDSYSEFHNEVGVLSERLTWVSDRLVDLLPGETGVHLMRSIVSDLESLLDNSTTVPKSDPAH